MNNKNDHQPAAINLDHFMTHLWNGKRQIFALTLACAAVVTMASFLITPIFRAEVAFLQTGSKQLPVFLKSRTVAGLVLREFPGLTALLAVKTPTPDNDAIALQKCISIRQPSQYDSPATLRVELPDPVLSANVANACMRLVASYVNTPEYDTDKRHVKYLEEQYDQYSTALRKAEEALRSFQEQHGIMLLDSQTAATVGLVAQIEARLIKKEIEFEALQNAPDNPGVQKRANEISALKGCLAELKGEQEGLVFTSGRSEAANRTGLSLGLATAPKLRLEHQRLRREVAVSEQACMRLMEQLGAARVKEEKEGTSFMIIDQAIPPEKPVYPNKPLFGFFGALLGFATAVLKLSLAAQAQRQPVEK